MTLDERMATAEAHIESLRENANRDREALREIVSDEREASRAVDRRLRVIERSMWGIAGAYAAWQVFVQFFHPGS